MRITLKDIAERAGVSVKTASNVINKRSNHYSQETQQRVMQASAELGYIPNLAARHLRAGKVGIIALVIPDILNPYFSEISQAIIHIAETLGYTVLIDFTDGDRKKESVIVNGARPLMVDGIILDPISLVYEDIHPGRVNVPVVLLGERLLDAPYDHVVIDNVAAARLATQHLIDLGCRRIAPIGVTSGTSLVMPYQRLEGYRQAMQAAELEVNPDYLMAVTAPTFNRSHGAAVMRQLLALDKPPEAIFCFNDLLALGAMTVLSEAGLRVPEDMAVVGFDDLIEARYSRPSLSTVAPDKEAISRLAVTSLIQRIQGERTSPPEIRQPPFKLIARASTLGQSYVEATEELTAR